MMLRLPWTKRADAERDRRIDAEKRLADVRADWRHLRDGIDAVEHNVRLNDFTRKARQIFGGRA